MKKSFKRFLAMLLAVVLVLGMTPSAASAARKKPIPGKVTLTGISAPAYNKITIKWKRVPNATHYKIYYKKVGVRKWTGVATVQGNKTSYTHTSSRKLPITIGRKYTYTVKAYNSKYKTYGYYNTRGLTTRTKPSTVRLKRAVLSRDQKTITLSWNRTSGCNSYCIYRRTPSTKWKRIANVRTPQTSYVDRSPVKGQKNIYTVRSYYSPTKRYGNYNSRGLIVNVPRSGSSSSSRKVMPGTVVLSTISASAYNKINIQWKKTSNATHYKIYYKKTETSKWTSIATVAGNQTSYTHTSSKSKPIKVGQKYIYTVKGYNSKFKTYGKYNSKGLSTYTKPSTVKLKGASLISNGKHVKITWNKASGLDKYVVYRKNSSRGSWKRIAIVKAGTTSYVDRNPVMNATNIYTVRGYYSPAKVYGKYDSYGVKVTLRTKADKAEYTYELKLLNPYKDIYTDQCSIVLYIKTKNPNPNSIRVCVEPDTIGDGMILPNFDDIKGEFDGRFLKVDGGYIYRPWPDKTGTFKFYVREIKRKYQNADFYISGQELSYCNETNASLTVKVQDYKQAGTKWIKELIQKYTNSSMTPKEKFEAIVNGEFSCYGEGEKNKYRYSAVQYNKNSGSYEYVYLLEDEGTIWQTKRLNSYTSPLLLQDIGYFVNYPVKTITANVSDPLHSYVKAPDGELYTICPMVETGDIGKIEYVDLSRY